MIPLRTLISVRSFLYPSTARHSGDRKPGRGADDRENHPPLDPHVCTGAHIRLSPMSPVQALALSSGEVKGLGLVNKGTGLPDESGLFAQRIFGPIETNRC